MGFGSINCSKCSGIGTIKKFVFNNNLQKICYACGNELVFSLLKIKKKIIYVDNNLLSTAYKGERKENTYKLLDVFSRLNDLINKQLIVCPYSDTHDIESSLYKGNEESSKLWQFIRNIGRGKQFYYQTKIKEQQLINAYSSFLNKGPVKSELILSNALPSNIHDWDDSIRIDSDWSIAKILKANTIKQWKEDFTTEVLQAIPQWRDSKLISEEACFKHEIMHYARILLEDYVNLKVSVNIEQIINNENFRIMSTLMRIGEGVKPLEERFNSVREFLVSEYFQKVPYINISAGLWAIIRCKIKQKQVLTSLREKKLKEEVRGFSQDITHLSIYAPYCDAIFTEKRMAQYFNAWVKHPLSEYPCKIFSNKNSEEFHNYLNNIENKITAEMLEELEIIYGN